MPHRCCHLPNNLKAHGGYSLYFTMGKEKNRAVVGGPTGPAMAWPLFLPRIFKTILCLLKSSVFSGHPSPLTTALRHYMAGPLFKSRLRPCKIAHFPGGSGPPTITWFLWPTLSPYAKRHLDFFCRFSTARSWLSPTDTQTCHVAYHARNGGNKTNNSL